MLGELDRNKKLGSRLRSKYPPRTDLSFGKAVKELKYLVSSLDTFSIVNPSSKNVTIVKEIVAVIEGMEIPEVIGMDNGKAQASN